MKVFDVQTAFTTSQPHYVVADNMAEAERIFQSKYGPIEIKSIHLLSEYVQVQKYDEQPKREKGGSDDKG